MELSKTQAATIEDKQSVNKLSSCGGNRGRRNPKNKVNSNQDGGRSVGKKLRARKSRSSSHESRKSRANCRYCGGDYPHPEGKTHCPAYQTTCQGCGKLKHFEAVYRSKTTVENGHVRRPAVNKVSEDESSDEDDVYTFSLSTKTLKDQPLFKIKVCDTPVTMAYVKLTSQSISMVLGNITINLISMD